MPEAVGRVLAIDIGDKRIGIAISDPTRTIAQPLTTLTRRAGKRFPMQQLRSMLGAYSPSTIVIGLPLTEEGDEGDRAQEARSIGELITTKSGLEVCYVDERMSTSRALRTVREMGGRTRGRKQDVDSLAATVILQRYLEQAP